MYTEYSISLRGRGVFEGISVPVGLPDAAALSRRLGARRRQGRARRPMNRASCRSSGAAACAAAWRRGSRACSGGADTRGAGVLGFGGEASLTD